MEKAEYIPYREIVSYLEEIQTGDIVYVVSDILELTKVAKENKERFNVSQFIEALQEKVGEEGTLLFPTFNWEFCKGKPFDYKKTPGKTGALGNKALFINDFKRSKHPIYSFVIWGKHKQELCQIDSKSSFGQSTIFDFMNQNNAKALVIGLPSLQGLTFIHYVEKMVGVPYRYDKDFTGLYIDELGNQEEKTYTMYVRDLVMNPLHINGFEPLSKLIEKQNLSITKKINGIEFHCINLSGIVPVIEKDILENDSKNMYKYNVKK